MKKTWTNVIIISLILVIAEITTTFLILHPYYKTQVVYNSIEEGNWIKTKEGYDALSSSQKERVQKYLPDFAAWQATEYAAGRCDYEQCMAVFDAINAIDETSTLYGKYVYDISKNEFVRVIRRLHEVETSFDNTEIYGLRDTLNNVSLRLDNTSREELLVMLLNEKYNEFIAESISSESAKAFVSVVISNSIYQAYDYAQVISNNIDYVVNYRSLYENAQVLFQEEDYFGAMDILGAITVAPEDTNYKTLVSDLYTEAYEGGKVYYNDQLNMYIKTGDKDAAIELMAEIELYYGDDFDITDAKEELAEEWQKACIDLVDDWEKDLKAALEESNTGNYILDNQYSDLKPDSMLLYDVNLDGVPELFLFNQERVENSYVECFVYVYIEGEYTYGEYINLMNFCTTSELVAFPENFDRASGEECVLVEYNGEEFEFGTECQKIDGTYYVNGSEVNDADYLSAQSKVLANINEKSISNSGYSSLIDSEKYILSY